METQGKRALNVAGVLLGAVVWFFGGVIKGSTGLGRK